jgi:hypothetical protein
MAVNDKILFEINERMKKGKVTKKHADEIYDRFLTYEKKREENIRSKRLDAILDEEKNPRVPKITDLGKVTQHKELKNRIHEIIEVKEKRLQELKIQNELLREKQLKEACTFTPKINKYRLVAQKRDLSNPPAPKTPDSHLSDLIGATDYLHQQPAAKQSDISCVLMPKTDQLLSDITFTEMPAKSCDKRASGPNPHKKKPANQHVTPASRAEDDFERRVITVEQLYSSKRHSQHQAQKLRKKDPSKPTTTTSKSPIGELKTPSTVQQEDKENQPIQNQQTTLTRTKSKSGLYKPGPLSVCNYSSINVAQEDSSLASFEPLAGEKKPAKEAKQSKQSEASHSRQQESKSLLKSIPEKQLEALLEELMNQQPGSTAKKQTGRQGQSFVLVDGKKLYYTQEDVHKVLCQRSKDN